MLKTKEFTIELEKIDASENPLRLEGENKGITELADLKFHDLRKTFCSLLAQNGVSTAVTQRLLEHSSPTLTNKIYTNIDPVFRQSIDQLPVRQWLQK